MALNHYVVVNYHDERSLTLFVIAGLDSLEGLLFSGWFGVVLSVLESTCTLFKVDLQGFTRYVPILPLTLTAPTLWDFFGKDFFVSEDTWELERWDCTFHQTLFQSGVVPNPLYSGSAWYYKRKARVWDDNVYVTEFGRDKRFLQDGSVINSSNNSPLLTLADGLYFMRSYEPPDPGTRVRTIPDVYVRYHLSGGADLYEFDEIYTSPEAPGRWFLQAREPSAQTAHYYGESLSNLPPIVSDHLYVNQGGLGYNSYYHRYLGSGSRIAPFYTLRSTNAPGNTHKQLPVAVGMVLADLASTGLLSQLGIRLNDDSD